MVMREIISHYSQIRRLQVSAFSLLVNTVEYIIRPTNSMNAQKNYLSIFCVHAKYRQTPYNLGMMYQLIQT